MVAEDLLDERRREPREAAPAELDGPGHPDPACLTERPVDGDRIAVGQHPLAPPLGVVLEQGTQAGAEGGRVGAEGALLGCRAEVQRWTTLPGRIGGVEHRHVFITVADGTRLAAQLWLPEHAARPGRARGASLSDGRPHVLVHRGVRAAVSSREGSPSAGSTSAAPARRAASPPTSTRPTSSTTSAR